MKKMTVNRTTLKFLLSMMMLALLLGACGKSNEDKIIGSWSAVVGDRTVSYIEINETRYTIRSKNSDPTTIEYILTETQDGNIIMEGVNPENNNSTEFLFEGYFEDNDTIVFIGDEEENRKLIRIDSITEQMAVDRKKDEAQQKKDQAAEQKRVEAEREQALKDEEERIREENEAAVAREEEERRQQEQDEAKAKEASSQQNIGDGSIYLQRADRLEADIIVEAKKVAQHDMPPGFYGQYYTDWDNLLNEVWGVLGDTLTKAEFEALKQNQKEWIQQKEQHFADIPTEPASERARGMDYLTFETKDRTYYLINEYL